MLQDLPVEVIAQIIGHLPTASSIVNLLRTNHKLHTIVSADNYNVFRTFVQRAFPSITTPPIWKDVARVLTSRSRAWDRRAFIARECYPAADDITYTPEYGYHGSGYHPVIDSYEIWSGNFWSSRKEVLAWGAAGRLQTRTTKDGVTTWSSYKTPGDSNQTRDILDVRLLRAHQRESSTGETIIFRRADREIIKVESSEADVFNQTSRFVTRPGDLTCMDISNETDPLLAACGDHRINLYPVHSSDELVQPIDCVKVAEQYKVSLRMRCAKFLSKNSLAIANQFLQGRDHAPISTYNISPTGLSSTPLAESVSYSETRYGAVGRHSANVIVPLDDFVSGGSGSGRLFLSGWTDGVARLYDTRTARKSVAEYVDTVDDGQVLSLLTVGHERFLAGSSQNGCLRTFDLRIPGARVYSYLNARSPLPTDSSKKATPQKDFNIFLTPAINYGERMWEPLPRRGQKSAQGYRGSVYSLSSPSPSSPTIYAGIANHVLQVDFVATDDVRNHKTDSEFNLPSKKSPGPQQHVLDLSCYERPRERRESTDAVLLRKQLDFSWTLKHKSVDWDRAPRDQGWDERLYLNTYAQDPGRRESGWRSQRRPPT